MARKHKVSLDPRISEIDRDIRFGLKARELAHKYGHTELQFFRYIKSGFYGEKSREPREVLSTAIVVNGDNDNSDNSDSADNDNDNGNDNPGTEQDDLYYILNAEITDDKKTLQTMTRIIQGLIKRAISDPGSLDALPVLYLKEYREFLKLRFQINAQLMAEEREKRLVPADGNYTVMDEWCDGLADIAKGKIEEN